MFETTTTLYSIRMLAAVGLAEDSSVVLVASMLVSPMMVCLFFFFLKIYGITFFDIFAATGPDSGRNIRNRYPR